MGPGGAVGAVIQAVPAGQLSGLGVFNLEASRCERIISTGVAISQTRCGRSRHYVKLDVFNILNSMLMM